MAKQTTLTDRPAPLQDFEQTPHPGHADTRESLREHYASVIGAFKDDPMLDAMMANIRERRAAMDADETA